MSISLRTHKMLWGRAASRCSFPDCRIELVTDGSEIDNESLIGDECHIVAKELNGSRGEFPLTPEKRDEYENLILMCKNHHKLIDDLPETYFVQKLKEMKALHIKWVRETLTGFDPAKQRDDEQYAEYVETWVKYTDLDNWTDWTGYWILVSAMPKISYKKLDNLEDLEQWLLKRVWPQRYPELDAAFDNFRLILHDLVEVFYRHSSSHGDSSWTEKFYDPPYGGPLDQNLYHEKLKEYKQHVELLGDLMLELTRGANYICDKVRQFIDPTFRMQEGVVLVAFGFGDVYRTEYRVNERILYPYPGLEQFEQDRNNRDINRSQYGLA